MICVAASWSRERPASGSGAIADLARACGFADPGYFGRVFKVHHGLTPQQWRRQRQQPAK